MTSISVQSVPTSVVVGPDGALYVGELTGAPFQPGSARIWRIAPNRKMSVYARGFTNISDLAFDGKNLLVLEIDSKGLLHPEASGALIRLAPNGTRTVLASPGTRRRLRLDLHLELRPLPRQWGWPARRNREHPRSGGLVITVAARRYDSQAGSRSPSMPCRPSPPDERVSEGARDRRNAGFGLTDKQVP
jgi:hypothetical protein